MIWMTRSKKFWPRWTVLRTDPPMYVISALFRAICYVPRIAKW
jgi:hypothetical protein